MSAHTNHLVAEPRKRSRKTKDKVVLKNIVSLRLSDREKLVLEKITESTSRSVSDVVREAIEFWLSKRQKLCRH